jgi:hypothetical protein
MSTTRFTIEDSDGNSVVFTYAEACDTGLNKSMYTTEMSQEKSAGSDLKQQIRPGKRFNKTYEMNISEAQYIAFNNLITNSADNYYIKYTATSIPTLLSNDTEVNTTNNFEVAFNVGKLKGNASEDGTIMYKFNLTIVGVSLS